MKKQSSEQTSCEIGTLAYEQVRTVERIKDTDFRRLTGVKPSTFSRMLEVFERELIKSKRPSGRPSHLSPADQLLMMLEYNRASEPM